MNHESLTALCLSFASTNAESPFGPDSVVFKVEGKMFAILSLNEARLNVKCDPEEAIQLREQYTAVEPGWHMNKKHWNSIYWDREHLDDTQLSAWVKASYDLVVAALPKKVQAAIRAAS